MAIKRVSSGVIRKMGPEDASMLALLAHQVLSTGDGKVVRRSPLLGSLRSSSARAIGKAMVHKAGSPATKKTAASLLSFVRSTST